MSAPLQTMNADVLDQPEQRFCPACGELRPIGEFGVNNARQDKLSLYCRKHTNAQVYKFLSTHPGYKAAQYRRSKECRRRVQRTRSQQ